METISAYTPTQCPVVLALQQFILSLKGSVNRAAVREAIVTSPQFPNVPLTTLTRILREWHIETTVFKAQPSVLDRLRGPLLAYCRRYDGNTYMVVIRRVAHNLVHYFSPFTGDVVEPLAEFSTHWQGLLLSAATSESETGRLAEDFDEETVAVERYRREAIRVHDHFVNPELCQYLIQYAEEQSRFEQSRVEASQGEKQLSTSRTSSSVTLKDRDHPTLQTIYQRVATLLGVPDQNIETLQCVRYSEGQQFKPHYDINAHNRPRHTLLLYLNDDFEGGDTFFPELNLGIRPVRGRVLHFLNCDENQQILLQAIHAGLPVRRGVKYACNIWVHDNLIG